MLNEQIRVVNFGKIEGGEAVEVVRTRNFIGVVLNKAFGKSRSVVMLKLECT